MSSLHVKAPDRPVAAVKHLFAVVAAAAAVVAPAAVEEGAAAQDVDTSFVVGLGSLGPASSRASAN